MNRRSFLRALGLGPVYALGGAALLKFAPAAATTYEWTEVSHTITVNAHDLWPGIQTWYNQAYPEWDAKREQHVKYYENPPL